jgi:hypothetical protein
MPAGQFVSRPGRKSSVLNDSALAIALPKQGHAGNHQPLLISSALRRLAAGANIEIRQPR